MKKGEMKMKKRKLLFTILALTLGTITISGLAFVEKNVNIASAEGTDFNINKKEKNITFQRK